MASHKKVDSKEVGLDIGLNLFKFFFESEYMHYGYWTSELEVIGPNLKKAQENYTNNLLSHIPLGVKNILDVGCGSGKVAEDLIEKGYKVAAVSPKSNLTTQAGNRLTGKATVTECKYEDYKGSSTVDLILFSESFQYIEMAQNFELSHRLLNNKGYIMLCDFFQTDAEGTSPLGGGHRLKDFYLTIPAEQFSIVLDQDITQQIAPTMTLINNLTMNVVLPSIQLLGTLLEDRYPWVYRFILWRFKKKIEKNKHKHFEGRRNAENFKKYKSYRLILLQKK